jgi:preprotein translocase subunit SecF
MSKEEIITGIKNALERGQSIEKATQSMINAGYNEREVSEAAQTIDFSTLTKIQQIQNTQISDKFIQQQTPTQNFLNMPSPNQNQTPVQNYISEQAQQQQTTQYQKLQTQNLVQENMKKKFPKIIIVLLIILFVLIAILISFSVIGPKILDMFFGK